MSQWNWKSVRARSAWRIGPEWLRPLLVAVPWITMLLLLLMMHMIGGTLASSEGVLFDLPDSTGVGDGERASLVALVMPMPHETLVFFDDGRYSLGDETSASLFCEQLAERAERSEDKTLLILADRRIVADELMKLSGIAKRSGINRVLFAEKRAGKAEE